MGCACSKASQASQPGQDAQEGASKAPGSEVHEIQSSEADSPPPQRSSARKEVQQAAHRARKVAPWIRPRAQKPAATSHNLKHWDPLWRTLE
eukprot:Skav215388  [mRNA]  locus=scaffold1194:86061:88327:- [translate_table: standard]